MTTLMPTAHVIPESGNPERHWIPEPAPYLIRGQARNDKHQKILSLCIKAQNEQLPGARSKLFFLHLTRLRYFVRLLE